MVIFHSYVSLPEGKFVYKPHEYYIVAPMLHGAGIFALANTPNSDPNVGKYSMHGAYISIINHSY